MMKDETCCCGNVLRSDLAFTMRSSPCRCAEPGDGRRVRPTRWMSSYVGEEQYNERRAAGLPVETGSEKAMRVREV